MNTWIQIAWFVLAIAAANASWCDEVIVTGATDPDVNGKYIVHFGSRLEHCDGQPMYQHQSQHYHLFYSDDWWLVNEAPCTQDGAVTALLRTRTFPSFRKPSKWHWQEKSINGWRDNKKITGVCRVYL